MKIIAALLLVSTLHLGAGELAGTVNVKTKKGKVLKQKNDRVLIFLEGELGKIPAKVLETTYIMGTEDKQFTPRLLGVPRGATVRFPNSDRIRHNAFSASSKNRFDAGLYGQGEGVTQIFESPGLVRVYCNVHHGMNAVIYVVPNQYFTYGDDQGHFSLEGVPDGTWKLTAVHRLAGKKSMQITVTDGRAEAVNMDLTLRRRKLAPHKNKHGKAYKRRSGRY